MIAKFIAVLAAVAQISASGCGCGQSTIILPTCESNSQSSPITLVSSGSCEPSIGNSFASGPFVRNIIAKGRYSVALRNCGPTPDQQIPMIASRITTPVQERPTVRLPANIPAPRTICHSCTCYKTILRPRVLQQVITVPTIQRYLETAHKPVVENVQYEAIPINCGRSGYSLGSGLQFLEVRGGSSSGCSCGCQTVQMPQVQLVEIPRVQVVEAVQAPEIQTVQMPQSCVSQF